MKTITALLILALMSAPISAQSDTYRYTLVGTDAHMNPPNKVVTAFDLFFQFAQNGTYWVTINIYPSHKQPLPGAVTFLDVTSNVAIKKGSSMDINSAFPISVYQLMDNMQWRRINGVTKVNAQTYRVPLTAWGTFGIVRESDALYSAKQAQPVANTTTTNPNQNQLTLLFKRNLWAIMSIGIVLLYFIWPRQPEKGAPRYRLNLKREL